MKSMVLVVRPQQCIRFRIVSDLLRVIHPLWEKLAVAVVHEETILAKWNAPVVSALTGSVIQRSLEDWKQEVVALERLIERQIQQLQRQVGRSLSIVRLQTLSELQSQLSESPILLELILPRLISLQTSPSIKSFGCILPASYTSTGMLPLLETLRSVLPYPIVCLTDDTGIREPVTGIQMVKSVSPLSLETIRQFLQSYRPDIVLVPQQWLDTEPTIREFFRTRSPVPVITVSTLSATPASF